MNREMVEAMEQSKTLCVNKPSEICQAMTRRIPMLAEYPNVVVFMAKKPFRKASAYFSPGNCDENEWINAFVWCELISCYYRIKYLFSLRDPEFGGLFC